MELIKVRPGAAKEAEILQLPAVLFPENYPLHFDAVSINPEFLLHSYLLRQDGRAIGSIALYHNPGHQLEGQPATCVGYFHCVNDTQAAKKLIDAVVADTRALGIQQIIGPLNGSTWENYRFRTTDEPPAFFLESAHPVYYKDLFRACGFQPIKSYYSFLVEPLQPMSDRASKRRTQFEAAGIRFRPIDPNHYERDVRRMYDLCLIAFKDNFLYTPYPWEAFAKKYSLLESIARPEMTLLAEEGDQVVGFVFMIDDVLCTEEKRFVFKTYAVHPGIKYAGLGAVISQQVTEALLQEGYTSSIHAFVIEGSPSYNASSSNSKVYREYQLYALNV
ncbi:MAG: hypothetical protein KDC44_11615 [Phaeodactylibacter sp.]|nr:hypothetical protein [Phaeodactylibacter sp.]